MKLSRVDFVPERELPERDPLPVMEEGERQPGLWLQLILSLARALVLLFMPLIALGVGFLVGRRFDSAWAMLGTVAVFFVAGGILVPGEPL
ncbi:hypothetical protein [Hyalangium minutum]|uniref:Uncharacterized protein n=1 Tax=Hyalangium minutum TaxID=394096 RepID=A0A085WWZ7_9BACT|nr:hypothetical protein [Hyalangium minutum]KFE72210.1 hypothetical protein DB31_0472 [Hyalangium minutum]